MSSQSILIVEDESEVRNYLEMALRCHGYSVQCAQDGPDAIARIAEADGDLSLVLLDLMLPRQDGLEVLRVIRRRDSRLPVIVLSGIASPPKVVEAMRCGATDFLAKPVTHDQLTRAVRKATQSNGAPQPGTPAESSRGGLFASQNPRIQAILKALKQIAVSDVPVVLRGESGVGKEVFAREIHALSPRAVKPFLKINCAALPLELLESELFGYERGAFTGAMKSTPGKFEVADGGVILLDEIGDMDFKLQAKLLHVLQDREFQRLGGRDTVRVDVRVLAATHCDLERAILEKRFREDLFYRLNVVGITIPPLRERQDEILPLAEFFLRKHAVQGLARPAIDSVLRDALLSYHWPGNIRELENVVRKLLVFADPAVVAEELRARGRRPATVSDPPIEAAPARALATHAPAAVSALERVDRERKQAEAQAILEALERTRWNRKRAARMLNIDYKGLLYKMKKLGIGPDEETRYRTRGARSLTERTAGVGCGYRGGQLIPPIDPAAPRIFPWENPLRVLVLCNFGMTACLHCNQHMAKVRRSWPEFIKYSWQMECPGCQTRAVRERLLISFLSCTSRCPKCGSSRLRVFRERDPIEDMYLNPISRLQSLIGAKICFCPMCRLQFHDLRPLTRS